MRSMDRWLWGLTGCAVLMAGALVYRAHRQNDVPQSVSEPEPAVDVQPQNLPSDRPPTAAAIANRAYMAERAGGDPRRTLLEDWGVNKKPAPVKPMVLVPPPQGVRCYGETAVEVKGSAYTQAVDSDGRPLRCVGGKVLVPAR